jgi:large subunit ribosomal protein L19
VKLGPRPWHERWERKDLKGVEDLGLPERFYEKAKKVAKPWEEYDLMLKYRNSINPEETDEIMREVAEGFKENERKKIKRRQGKFEGDNS